MDTNKRELLGRYQIVSELGSGGMGTVYLTRDTTLQRDVAIKVLNDATVVDAVSVERFKREVKAIASLSHPNVIGLYDFTDEDGTYFAVMEYAQGTTLDERLTAQPLSRDEAMQIAAGMASGLAAAHQAGVIHRDIKPSNVMITRDNQVKLLDFGLATERQTLDLGDETMSSPELKTQVGTIMGTVGYMSPEQVKGNASDKRSDIFSFGAVLFEMLTGQRAFKRDSTIETMSAILNESVPQIDATALPSNDPLFAIAKKCLEKSADHRYQDVTELIDALDAIDSGPELSSKKATGISNRILAVAGGAVIAIVAVFLFLQSSGTSPTHSDSTGQNEEAESASGTPSIDAANRARQVDLPQMLDLVNEGEFIQAYAIGEKLKEHLAEDALFKVAWEKVARPFTITSTPVGATVRYGDYGTDPSTFTELGQTPITETRLSTSPKQFIFTLDGHHSAIATTDNHFFDSITMVSRELSKVGEIPEGMIRITEGKGFMLTGMVFDKSVADGFAPTVDAFLIDKYEVTNQQYMKFVSAGGYTKREYWTDSFTRQGEEVDFAEAMKLMIDSTGRPGPAMWAVGRFESGRENYPVQGVSWYEARAYAKFLGKSLPTLYHWSRANESFIGTDGLGRMVLRSNINKGTYSEVGSYTGVSPFGVSDLCGNVSEWVVNAVGSQRLSLGGSTEDQEYFFNQANPADPFDRSQKRGFRCIKYRSDKSAELLADIQLHYRDYTDATKVSDEIFAVYKNQFDYDNSALEPVVSYSKQDESPDFVKERVEFNAAYGGERMIAYLYLPKNSKPPYQTLIFFHGAGAINPVTSEDNLRAMDSFKFIPQSGRAFVVPVLKGQWDRNDGLETWASNDSQQYAEFLIKWTKDFRRTVDYLESRDDVDATKIGYMGASWGAFNFLITGAVEPRLKLSLCFVGGLSMTPARPEVDQISYVHRVKQPTLWLVGEYDQIFPLKQSSRPAFEYLGTDPKDKKLVVFPSGHSLPVNDRIRESLDFLDKYFGPAQ